MSIPKTTPVFMAGTRAVTQEGRIFVVRCTTCSKPKSWHAKRAEATSAALKNSTRGCSCGAN